MQAQKTLSYVRANNYLKMVIFVLLFLWLDWIVQQPLEVRATASFF